MRVAVITANIGGIDSVKSFPQQSIEFEFFSYTEKELPYPMKGLDDRLKAKLFRMQAHRFLNHDIIVWVDGNVNIKRRDFLENMLSKLGPDDDIVISKHPVRHSVYEEAEFITSEVQKGNTYLKARYDGSIQSEIKMIESRGLPKDTGLYWCGLFLYRNTNKVNEMFNGWWMDNILWSNFDQNTFVYRVWNHDIKLSTIEWGAFTDNEHYSLANHTKLK